MILPALVALPAALGLLLRGGWDLWAQSGIHVATVAGLTLWALTRTAVGYLPLPSNRNLVWTAVLLLLGSASVWTSPVNALALPEWYNFLNALWLFPLMASVSKDERALVDEAIRVVAWILMILAFYQHFRLGDERPASALMNQNVYAGAVLLLLPLALEKNDRLLAAGLLLNLWWARSVGAWLGLAAALVITRRWRGGALAWAGLGLGVVCLAVIYGKFQSPEVLNRLAWWGSAVEMIYDRPLAGFGPGSFAFVLPAYREGGGLATLYAHQYFLQTAAEYGFLFAVVWFAGIWSCVMRGASPKRFGALAVLVHSCWDWTLSVPAILWLFSYFASSSLTEESRGINIQSRYKPAAAAAILAAGFWLGAGAWELWAADRAKSLAVLAAGAGDWEGARRQASLSVARVGGDPETHLILARAELARAAGPGARPALSAAAGHLERAAELNPFRSGTWVELARVYRALGWPERADDALARGARHCLRLRPASGAAS